MHRLLFLEPPRWGFRRRTKENPLGFSTRRLKLEGNSSSSFPFVYLMCGRCRHRRRRMIYSLLLFLLFFFWLFDDVSFYSLSAFCVFAPRCCLSTTEKNKKKKLQKEREKGREILCDEFHIKCDFRYLLSQSFQE